MELTTADEIRTALEGSVTIAVLGAHDERSRAAFFVPQYLHDQGYRVLPVNPRLVGRTLWGQAVVATLAQLEEPVDMVDVFRSSDALMQVAREAIAIKAKVLWGQIGVRDDAAARLAEEAGLKVVMNRCPKIELFRPFWKPRLNQAI